MRKLHLPFNSLLLLTLLLEGGIESNATQEKQLPPPNTLFISEFMASNGATLLDEDGDSSDWVEIHNPTAGVANLNGMYLTDNSALRTQWMFPNVSIPAGGYLVVFASSKDRTNPASELHTSFNLARDGDFLGLVDTDGVTLFHSYTPEYPPQRRDVSYGVGGSELGYFDTPTPNAANGTPLNGLVADTKFSVDRGLYFSSFTVNVTTDTPGADIRYTTDGTKPTDSNGTLFSTPISITTTTTLRAAAFKTGYLPTDVDTQTYLFPNDVLNQAITPTGFPLNWGGGSGPDANILLMGDYEVDPEIVLSPTYSGRVLDALTSLPALSLVMPISSWFDPETGIYSNTRAEGVAWERECSAELLLSGTEEGFSINTGIRIQGGSSTNNQYKSPKLSLRLLFKDEYGPTKLNYDLYPDSEVESFNTLVLDARLNQAWIHNFSPDQREKAQYTRDAYMSNLQLETGHLSVHNIYVHLYLNGLYWGIYTIHERPDDAFLAEYLGGDRENFDVLRHTDSNVVAGSNVDYLQMLALADSGLSDDADYDMLAQQYLDIPNFIDYMLLNFWGGNTDWAHHNWYCGRDRTDGSLFRYYCWDAEHVLKDVNQDETGTNNSGAPTRIFHQAVFNTEFRFQFADRTQHQFFNEGVFTATKTLEIYERLVDRIDSAVIMESARWGDHRRDHNPAALPAFLYTRDEHWIDELTRLRDTYFPFRTAIVLQQLRDRGFFPDLDAPSFSVNGSPQHGGAISSGDLLSIQNPNGSGTIYYTTDGVDPREATVASATPTFAVDLVAEASAKTVFVASSDVHGTMWTGGNEPFDDSTWTAGTGGVGFDENTTYDSLINIDVNAEMNGNYFGAYVRIPFNVEAADLAKINFLIFEARYDDGFVVYLNGVRVDSDNAEGAGALAWDSRATGGHSDSLAVGLVAFDITSASNLLVVGQNILAVHAMNRNSARNNDFLISVKLEGLEEAPTVGGFTGDESASATAYTIPVPLDETTQVLARVLDGGEWSALLDATFIGDSVASSLRISEIMYHPADVPAGTPLAEFVELKNIGLAPINLLGVEFTDGIAFTFPDTSLDPGEYVLAVKDIAAFESEYGMGLNVAGEFGLSLSNDGEQIILADGLNNEIHNFVYDDAWYPSTDGGGFSLTLIDPTDPVLTNWGLMPSWRPSGIAGGTPGTEGSSNSIPNPGAIIFNEVLTHSDGGTPDWIELYNTTGGSIDLGGWFLSDSDTDLTKYEIANGVSIPAGGFLTFFQDTHFGNALDPGSGQVFGLSENGESVYLSSGSGGALTGYLKEQEFGASETAVAFGQHTNSIGDVEFVAMSSNTPGGTNALPKVGPIIISELMYNPSIAQTEEYVELHNITDSPVDLFDIDGIPWRFTDGIQYIFPPSTTIPPKGVVALAKDPAAFAIRYSVPGETIVLGPYAGQLNNGGERVEIAMPGDLDMEGLRHFIRIEHVNYSDSSPWPTQPDGNGHSLSRIVPAEYGNDVASWESTLPTPGTPLSTAAVSAWKFY